MRKVKFPIVLALLSTLLAGCAHHVPVNPPIVKTDWTVKATWNYDFTNFKQCSATITNGCISGFSWGYLQGATKVPLHTAPVSVCAGSACADTVNVQLGIGAHTFYASANYVDNSGSSGVTAGVNSPVLQIPAGEVSNLAVTAQ